MSPAYRYPLLPCPVCGKLIAGNWVLRHARKAHPAAQEARPLSRFLSINLMNWHREFEEFVAFMNKFAQAFNLEGFDSAMQAYAAALGKSANELTDDERKQAWLNHVLKHREAQESK